MKRLLLFFLFIFHLQDTIAQDYMVQSFSDIFDFDVRTVYDLIQSKDERLWLGTDQGVFCFNQREIKRFADSKYQSEFSNLKEDPQGRIWFENFSGHIFYIENDSLHLFKDLSPYTRSGLITVDISRFPTIYANSEYGIFEFDFHDTQNSSILTFSGKEVVKSDIDELEKTLLVDFVAVGEAIYFTTDSVVYLYEDGEVREVFTIDSSDGLNIKFVKVNDKLLVTQSNQDGRLVFYKVSGLTYDKVSYENMYGVVSQSIHYMHEKKQVWLGTQSGFFIFDENLNRISEDPLLANLYVTSFWQDAEGNYLVSTLNEGLQIIPNLIIQVFNKNNSTLSSDNVVDIVVGPDNSFFILDEQNNLYQLFPDSLTLKLLYHCQQRVSAIYYNEGLHAVHLFPSSEQFNLKDFKPESNKFKNIKAFNAFDSTNWLISQSGQAIIASTIDSKSRNDLMDYMTGGRYYYQNPDFKEFTVRDKRSTANLIVKDDFFVAYSDALFYYSKGESDEILFEGNPIAAIDLVHNNGDVWIAATDGSLFIRNRNGEIKRMVSFNVAIKNLAVYSDKIIVVCSKAIFSFDPSTNKLLKSDHTNGIFTSEIHKAKVLADQIYIATYNGLLRFPLSFLQSKNFHQPKVSLDRVKVNQKLSNLDAIQTLDYVENNIQFEFSTYALKSQNTYQLAYRFENKEQNWQSVNDLYLSFQALQPGNYELSYKLINEDGVESKAQLPISFKIAYPFYRQTWFYLLVLITSILIIGGFFNYRFNVQKEKAQMQQQLAMSTLSSIKAQMNPHFIFNALNSIQDYIISNEKKLARLFLVKFSRLIRIYLEHSQTNVVSLAEEISALKLYLELEKARFDDDFNFDINVDEKLDSKNILMPSFFIQPYVENAIKHGLLHKRINKRLQINFINNKITDQLIVEVIDNGIGRKASAKIKSQYNQEHVSFATSANQKRLDLLNKSQKMPIELRIEDVLDSNHSAAGTKVTIKISLTS